MSATTDKAVAEGQHDVQSAKATGAGYLDQAKALAGAAVSTAQSYMPSTAQANGTANGLVGSLQSAATTALATGKQYFQTVSATAQPHVDAAKAAAQPHIDKALETASGYVGAAQSKVGSATSTDTGIPSTSAPLESGPHTVGTPYPSTTTTQGSDELAKGPSTLSVGENSA
ncbi:hypothetical protein NEOLEDRAFT_1126473 [Neolentinus lepideus HHB14362 ss-1]|uniref:Uncharacterized protein n=1 Tax=Neolentinus lepideus HHB14362 ss-1 TaxID=1314782 RepID=A0A165W8L8_9AGAM|nr:hypothetical protein NEOLEDRAFT_1126473 [Neolentinus lepideus HHB14362 ss-1]